MLDSARCTRTGRPVCPNRQAGTGLDRSIRRNGAPVGPRRGVRRAHACATRRTRDARRVRAMRWWCAHALVMKLEGPSWTEPVQIIRVESTPSSASSFCCTSVAASPSGKSCRSTTLYAISSRDVLSCCAMLRLSEPRSVVIVPRMPGLLRLTMQRRAFSASWRSSCAAGKLTEFLMVPVSRKLRIWSAAILAQLSSASSVEAPRCGMQRKFLWPVRYSSGKSQTYLPVWPASYIFFSAAPSTISARAKLMMEQLGFMTEMTSSPMMWWVTPLM
mmetsp:Transcript_23677/g.58530  ORF Transcript_23677/g.58530 Transcript_23677/m.58530 type:complete len:274 (+) Transcript_23677:399-1220(+)